MSSTKGGISDHQFWEYWSFGRFFTSHFVLIKTSIIPSFTKPLWLGNLGTKIKNLFFAFSVLIFMAQSSLSVKLFFKEQTFMRERPKSKWFSFFCIFFGGLECVGPLFAYVAHFVFLRDAWIRTQWAAVASSSATNLATHLPKSSP